MPRDKALIEAMREVIRAALTRMEVNGEDHNSSVVIELMRFLGGWLRTASGEFAPDIDHHTHRHARAKWLGSVIEDITDPHRFEGRPPVNDEMVERLEALTKDIQHGAFSLMNP